MTPRELPPRVTHIRTEFYVPRDEKEPAPVEVTWAPLAQDIHDQLRKHFEGRGANRILGERELACLRPIIDKGWQLQAGKFRRSPSRYQVVEIEEMPRRASYRNAVVDRITMWSSPTATFAID